MIARLEERVQVRMLNRRQIPDSESRDMMGSCLLYTSDQCSTACNLYPEASPKAISGRTSYLHVRLEVHLYPHLILTLFNGYRFGPPHIFTCASTWTWVDHCGFGSMQSNYSP